MIKAWARADQTQAGRHRHRCRSQFPSEKWKQDSDSCRLGSRSRVSIQNLNIIQYSPKYQIFQVERNIHCTGFRPRHTRVTPEEYKQKMISMPEWEVHHLIIMSSCQWFKNPWAVTWSDTGTIHRWHDVRSKYVPKDKSVTTGMQLIRS